MMPLRARHIVKSERLQGVSICVRSGHTELMHTVAFTAFCGLPHDLSAYCYWQHISSLLCMPCNYSAGQLLANGMAMCAGVDMTLAKGSSRS